MAVIALIIEVLKGGWFEQMKPCNSMDQWNNCELQVMHLDEQGGMMYPNFFITLTHPNSGEQ